MKPTSIVGRVAERARLAEVAEAVLLGESHMVIVRGEAGIGKSALLADLLAQWGQAGWSVYSGRCVDYTAHSLPFGPMVSVLRSLLAAGLDVSQLRIGDLSILLPELRLDADEQPSLRGDADRLLDAIGATLAAAAAKGPVAVLVEDIHWSDAATRDLLSNLVRTLGASRVLLLVTERTGGGRGDEPFLTWSAEVRRFDCVSVLELDGLSVEELVEQCEALTGHVLATERSQALHNRTKGNAYYAQELIVAKASGMQELPSSLLDFIGARLRRCTPEQLAVMRLFVVAHSAVSHSLLKRLLPDDDLPRIVRQLVDGALLEVDGGAYRPRHGLISEVLEADLLPFEAEEIHGRFALAMEADPRSGQSPADLATMAIHWSGAGDHERCLRASVQAAEAASRAAAYETAAEMGLQALREWPLCSDPESVVGQCRIEVLIAVSEWLSLVSRGREAIDLVDEALATWVDLTDGQRARLMARVSVRHHRLGQPVETAARLASAERLVGDEVSVEAAEVHHAVSKQALLDGQIEPARVSAERALAIAAQVGPLAVEVEAMTTLGLTTGVSGAQEQGIALARASRAKALEANLVAQVANSYRTEMLIVNFNEGRTPAGLEAVRAGLRFAEQHCGPRWRADLRLHLFLGLVEAGMLAEAAEIFQELDGVGFDDLQSLTLSQTAAMYSLMVGELAVAAQHLDEVEGVAQRYNSGQETGVQAKTRAELARRVDDLDGALVLIDQALELQFGHDNLSCTRESLVEKLRVVRALAARGPVPQELIDITESQIRAFEGPGRANQAMKTLMEVEWSIVAGSFERSVAVEAVELLDSCGLVYESAQLQLLIIESMAGESELDDDCRLFLNRQIEALRRQARSAGMTWIAERAGALGSRVIDLKQSEMANSPAPFGDLTPRETEVLALLATGKTNRTIAEQLFVSPRTVSTHVSNILAKMGVTTRGEAGARYREVGIDIPV